MATNYTTNLGLALPTTGELVGTWGDTVNAGITNLLDSAIAGATSLSTDADVTLTTTQGSANQARQMILLCTGARSATRYITAPAQSKTYVVINNTSGSQNIVIRGAGPTTGVTVSPGAIAHVAWNGSDFVSVGLSTAYSIGMTGDVTWSVNFSGSGNVSASATLATVATPGTYKSVTIDAKGRVTGGSNPTTLAGYGITDAAPIASPNFTGTPTAVTATTGTNTTQLATTAFVQSAIGSTGSVVYETNSANILMDGTVSVGSVSTLPRADHRHPTDTTRAALVDPNFSGTPRAPTAAADTNTTQIASTAFVLGQASSTSPAMNSTASVGSSYRYARGDHVHPSDTSKAGLDSPTFTGTPTRATNPTVGSRTAQLATMAMFGASGEFPWYQAATGSQKLPSGLFIFWGTTTSTTTSSSNATATLVFPSGQSLATGVVAAIGIPYGTGAGNVNVKLSGSSTTTVTFTVSDGSSYLNGIGVYYIAIGY